MNILILGGNRFVGKKLAEILSTKNRVTIFNRSGTGPKNCDIIKGDRNMSLEIDKKFNVVIDFCLFKKEQAELLISKIHPHQHYIFISSGAAYKDNNCLLYNETMPIGGLKAFGQYGIEKAECEEVIINSKLNNYIILRPPYVDGPNSHKQRIKYYIDNIRKGLPVEVNGDGSKILSFVHVDDVVGVISDILTYPHLYGFKQIYNIVSGDFYSSKSLIKEISDFLNISAIIKENGINAPFINENYMLSPTKLRRKFFTIKEKLPEFLYEQKII